MITQEQINLAKKFISPDAFLLIVKAALEQNKALSAVGFGDGERSIMINSNAHYLKNPEYLKEYGLIGANLTEIGKELFKAANEADWFCPLISGITMKDFDCIRIVSPREQYVERLFTYSWYYMQRVDELFKSYSCAVVCRNSQRIAENLIRKYALGSVQAIEYSSWTDCNTALKQIKESKFNLILCSVSQSGKLMIVEAAKSGKVVLDIGSALINKWQE